MHFSRRTTSVTPIDKALAVAYGYSELSVADSLLSHFWNPPDHLKSTAHQPAQRSIASASLAPPRGRPVGDTRDGHQGEDTLASKYTGG